MATEPNGLRKVVTCDISEQGPDASLLAVFQVLDKDNSGKVER
jgi:Ca2+-binding EF-hand superfamily protein